MIPEREITGLSPCPNTKPSAKGPCGHRPVTAPLSPNLVGYWQFLSDLVRALLYNRHRGDKLPLNWVRLTPRIAVDGTLEAAFVTSNFAS